MTPAGTSNELDVQNGWEENTHTHTHTAAVLARFVVVITFSRVEINRKVANLVHMISWPGKNFLVPVPAWKFGFARQIWPSRLVSACSFSTLRLNLVLTHGIAPDVHGGIHIFIFPTPTTIQSMFKYKILVLLYCCCTDTFCCCHNIYW